METQRSPLPRALTPFGTALEPVYRWAVRRRNAGFDRGDRVWRAPVPVVSVGNLSVGGTGKTPMVMWLARETQARGIRPVIAMRGYAKRDGQPSDEEAEYLAALGGVRVLANPDRAGAIAAFLDGGGKADLVLLDDGFQHRFVARDVDVVLIDATRDPFADRCLPAGWLREPVESLRRAHAIVLTRADRVSDTRVRGITERIRAVAGQGVVIATTSHRWAHIERRHPEHAGQHSERLAPREALRGKRVRIVAGISNPGAFTAQAGPSARRSPARLRCPITHYTRDLVRNITHDAQGHGADGAHDREGLGEDRPCSARPRARGRVARPDRRDGVPGRARRTARGCGSAPSRPQRRRYRPRHDRSNTLSLPALWATLERDPRVETLLRLARDEDLGDAGDITARAMRSDTRTARPRCAAPR